jgi:ClpP class serine protease
MEAFVADLVPLSGPWSLSGFERAADVTRLVRLADGMSSGARDGLAIGPVRRPDPPSPTGTVVIRLAGVLLPNPPAWMCALGFASCASIAAGLERAAADRRVRRIVLAVDSPGGAVAGAIELADVVRRVASTTPIVAAVEGIAESLAFMLAAQATELVAAPSASLAAPAVVLERLDWPPAVEPPSVSGGLARELLARAARGRGVALADAAARFHGGRVVPASTALAAGMVDRLCTLDDLLAERRGPAVH